MSAELVRAFLDAMEARDLERARTMLADGFTMTFPGGAIFTSLDELVAWSRGRYRQVRKVYEQCDEAPAGDGQTAVYCFGTLTGEWPDGTAFAGIRFIDRFTVADGRLVDQRVWNDMAEIRPGPIGEIPT